MALKPIAERIISNLTQRSQEFKETAKESKCDENASHEEPQPELNEEKIDDQDDSSETSDFDDFDDISSLLSDISTPAYEGGKRHATLHLKIMELLLK